MAERNDRILFEHYSGESGLSHIGVNTIRQDSNGFLWIGTYDGLNRYDGFKFTVFRHVPGDSTSLIHNRVYSIIETSEGMLWVGTEEGLCVYDSKYEIFKRPEFVDFPLRKVKILNLYEDSNNRLWILTNNSNIYIIGKDRKSIKNISYFTNNSSGTLFFNMIEGPEGHFFIASSSGLLIFNRQLEVVKNDFQDAALSIRSLAIDKDSMLWLGSGNGLILTKIVSITEKSVQIIEEKRFFEGSNVNSLVIDKNFHIWFGLLFNGLHKITKDSKGIFNLSSFYHNPEKLKSLSSDRISVIYEDRQGIIWVGTSENGINKYNPAFQGFHSYNQLNPGVYGPKSDYILSFAEYENQIFIGTRGKGIFIMDPGTGTYLKSKYDLDAFNELSVSALWRDSRNILWIGTWRGLFRLLPGKKEPERINYPSNVIYDIGEDDFGNIWLGTRNGLFKIRINQDLSISDVIERMLDIETSDNRLIVFKVYNDPFDHSLWIGTWHNGLFHLKINNTESASAAMSYSHYYKDSENKNALQSNFVTSILRCSNKDIWIGTEGGGVNYGSITGDRITFKIYTELEGLSNNSVKSIIRDDSNNLWISTNHGLNKFMLKSEEFKIYYQNQGISSNFFTNAALKLNEKMFLLGGNNGFTVFDPHIIVNDTIPPIPEFGSFLLSNEKILPLQPINGKVILSQSISEAEQLNLKYNQNTFSLELLALQFTDPLNNRFKYILHGFDADWIYPRKGEHYANYTKIKPGFYSFEFLVANSSNIWSSESKTLNIRIQPPFWATKYAYIFYIGLILLIFIFSLKLNKKIVTLKHKVELEQLEATKNQELTEVKVKFFMNISHEFKTPITLILGPLQRLEDYFSHDGHAKKYLSIIKSQADYLMNLLDQLVYFRKAESAILELKCEKKNIVEFIEDIIKPYEWEANEKEIDFKFVYTEREIFLWFDPKMIEKVIYNLISNAFKFTYAGGKITLTAINDSIHKKVIILVRDTGKGISFKDQQNIFERFYQVDSAAGGYGIGLSLTKSLVDLHQGTISFVSNEGKGTEFRIELQTGTAHLQNEQLVNVGPEYIPSTAAIIENRKEVPSKHKNAKEFTDDQNNLILIVEDNPRMLSFLEDVLSREFRVVTARNGALALELLISSLPDLILSDVMMPGTDGIELCRKIKNNILTCHIPVVLLSAKSEIESRIEGLETGADHYIPKPFDVNLLLAELKSIIQNRNKIKERIARNLPFDLSAEEIHPLDKDLLERINRIIEDNYTNSDFDSTQFSKEIFMNRSQFFKKMKAVTNQTPTDYIRAFRMNKAVEFMLKENSSVSDVCFKVGIQSRSYFIKCFKETYGESPGRFIKKRS